MLNLILNLSILPRHVTLWNFGKWTSKTCIWFIRLQSKEHRRIEYTQVGAPFFLLNPPSNKCFPLSLPYLGLNVSIVVILEQQGGRLGVVLAGCDVQGWQTDFTLGVVLQEQGDHRVVALLKRDGQWSESVLTESAAKERTWKTAINSEKGERKHG